MRGAGMRELVTTLLDALAILLIAAGAGFYVSQWIGWSALGVVGVVVLAGSQVSAWRGDS